MHLTTEVVRDSYAQSTDGKCPEQSLRSIPFMELLGIELMARTEKAERAATAQAAFALLARAENDKAAKDALDATYRLVHTTIGSSPFEMQITPDQFALKGRIESRNFLTWIIAEYWTHFLYKPSSWEERTNGEYYFCLRSALKGSRSAAIEYAATIWAMKPDIVARTAFEFLCDNVDSRRYAEKATGLATSIEDYQKRRGFEQAYFGFELPKEDIEMVLGHMRKAISAAKIETVRHWGEYARMSSPKNVQNLLAHAFVNAGADVFKT